MSEKKKIMEEISRHLQQGTIPHDASIRNMCMIASALGVTFAAEAMKSGEDILMLFVHQGEDESVSLPKIHAVWQRSAQIRIEKSKTNIARGYAGSISLPVSDEIDMYITYRRLVFTQCDQCKTVYVSDVNKYRCEASHPPRGKRLPKVHPVNAMIECWDAMDTMARKDLVGRAIGTVQIPHDIKWRIMKVARGDVDLSGKELVDALDKASESTFMLVIIREVHLKAVYGRDYAAMVASVIGGKLVDECYVRLKQKADAAASELLEAEEAAKRKAVRKKRKKPKAKAMDSPGDETHFNFSVLVSEEEDLSEDEKLARLEYLIFNTCAFKRDIVCWADEDF